MSEMQKLTLQIIKLQEVVHKLGVGINARFEQLEDKIIARNGANDQLISVGCQVNANDEAEPVTPASKRTRVITSITPEKVHQRTSIAFTSDLDVSLCEAVAKTGKQWTEICKQSTFEGFDKEKLRARYRVLKTRNTN